MSSFRSFFRIIIEYDGSGFHGWTQQPGLKSIEGTLSAAAQRLYGQKPDLGIAGRTDAGVHGLGNCVHMLFRDQAPADRMLPGMNFHLKNFPVVLRHAWKMQDPFHARHDCIGRVYLYRISTRPTRPLLDAHRVYWHPRRLDLDAIAEAAAMFEGTHDFRFFRARGCQARSTSKTIEKFLIDEHDDEMRFFIVAPSFLYRQVRFMVGALLLVGRHARPVSWLKDVLRGEDTQHGSHVVPARGLYFHTALYAEDAFSHKAIAATPLRAHIKPILERLCVCYSSRRRPGFRQAGA